jgi:hypothetical protein
MQQLHMLLSKCMALSIMLNGAEPQQKEALLSELVSNLPAWHVAWHI